jgi:hypothetical protein
MLTNIFYNLNSIINIYVLQFNVEVACWELYSKNSTYTEGLNSLNFLSVSCFLFDDTCDNIFCCLCHNLLKL